MAVEKNCQLIGMSHFIGMSFSTSKDYVRLFQIPEARHLFVFNKFVEFFPKLTVQLLNAQLLGKVLSCPERVWVLG